MVFSSAIFLFVFLPVVFVLDRLLRGIRAKNILLLVASLIFYSFGQPVYLPLLLLSVALNYVCGLLAAGKVSQTGRRDCGRGRHRSAGGVQIRRLCDWHGERLFGMSLPLTGIALPIGISFFTFQGLVLCDRRVPRSSVVSRSFVKVLLYISYFPQLIAGRSSNTMTSKRRSTSGRPRRARLRWASGGLSADLSKKLLISNAMGQMADAVFALPAGEIGMFAAWTGAICYTLQIYFDFSGYSDMAIGMGRMFGFHFLENFDYPYASTTIQEFWRRWHISLSTWFRDYLYIPLGGNRKGRVRTWVNRVIVFFTTGLWHGANWTFVLWGLWHGLFSVLEDSGIVPASGSRAERRACVYRAGGRARLYAVPCGIALRRRARCLRRCSPAWVWAGQEP